MARRRAEAPRRTSFAKHLVILAKSPHLGRVKHRLGREIGDVAAIRFYRFCLSHAVSRLGRDPRWRTVLAIDPDRDMAARIWPSRRRVALLPQGRGDLGRRMQRLFANLPPGPAVIIGSDIPAIRPHHIADAFRLLGRSDAVLGKAPDGGYWMVGLKRVPKVLTPFARVRWSSPHAFADTLKNLEGKRVGFAATLSDIDTAQAWQFERASAARLVPPARMSQQ